MVHCNGDVILVDFYVKESKDYSFFLDDEMYELTLEKKDDRFGYLLQSNKTADTPLNRILKKKERKDLLKAGAFAGGLMILIIGLFVGMKLWRDHNVETEMIALVKGDGEQSVARFLKDPHDSTVIRYYFVAAGDPRAIYSTTEKLEQRSRGSRLFPLENNDEFEIIYAKSSPDAHLVLWDNPSEKQVEKYMDRTRKVHQSAHPDFSHQQVDCQVNLAFQLDSLEGLAQLFYQTAGESENVRFNENSFLKFIRDEPFRRLNAENCWY